MNTQWRDLYFDNKILNGIYGFVGKYKIFSNFARHEKISIILPYGDKSGKKYSSDNIEVLFQAAKLTDENKIKEIINSNDPSIAKYLGRRYKLRKDWEEIKEEIMYELLKKKFNVSNEFRNTLLSVPDDDYIVEMNRHCDKEWGVCSKTFHGNNKLGKLLMKLKDEKKGK